MATTYNMNERQMRQGTNISWGLILANGIVSILAGIIILNITWTPLTLGYFLGAFLIIRGIFQTFSPSHEKSMSAWNIFAGILSVLVGAAIIAYPAVLATSLVILAIFIGAWLVVWGVITFASSIASRRDVSFWWLTMMGGILSVGLGIFALNRPFLTLATTIFVIGIWAIVAGIVEIGLSIEIKNHKNEMKKMQYQQSKKMAA